MRLNEQWRNADIVDGFTMSASQLLVPTSYRALILGQMDVLRRASAMRPRHYIARSQFFQRMIALHKSLAAAVAEVCTLAAQRFRQ